MSQQEALPTEMPEVLVTPQAEATVTAQYGTQEQSCDVPASACLLHIPKDSPLLQRQWTSRDSYQEFESGDPLVIMEKLQRAVKQVISEKTNLEYCLKQKLGENEVNTKKLSISECELESAKKDLTLCQEEREEYKQKYTLATEIFAEMEQSFQHEFKSLTEKSQQAKETHKEKEADLRYTLKFQDKCVNELEAKLKHRDFELKNFTSKLKDKQSEVEKLRETLTQKEKELEEMETELEAKASEIEILEKWTKDEAINQQQKTVGNQLQKCQEIGKLLERFPHIRTQEELEKTSNQIMEEITKMKVSMKHKKSFSWR